MDLEIHPLGREHARLLETFKCSVPYGGDELVRHLQHDAINEQDTDISSTFVVVSPDLRSIDAFMTLSNTSIVLPREIQKDLAMARKYVPAVMIDYIAVSDSAREHGHRGLGQQLFERIKNDAFEMNRVAGVRFVALEVRAGNWPAYQIYSLRWGMKALPIRANPPRYPNDYPVPNPHLAERPSDLAPERLITMFFDLYEEYGPYWPRPEGLEEHA